MERPNPKSVRDLRLAYETTNKIDGNIEYKPYSHENEENAITHMCLRVVPDLYGDVVHVIVERGMMTNVRKSEYGGCSYSPKRIVDWSKDYTFGEFRESPFYDMAIDEWGKHWRTKWDTSAMDGSYVEDDETRWIISASVYRHEHDFLRNWRKSGDIDDVYIRLDEDGDVELYLNGDEVWDGDVWGLEKTIREHRQMTAQMERLREHGVDIDEGVLHMRLWGGSEE